ncbi:MAG: hypothetical protein IPJ77_12815 [Planctomycetes bacterium]|nr:hypothetical protein [Planctomycetota bacterium]
MTPLLRTRRPAPPARPDYMREPWFEALSPERKARFAAQWHQGRAHDARLARDSQARRTSDIVRLALLFAFADLVAPGRSFASLALALVFGAVGGLALHALDRGRFVTAFTGVALFLALEIPTRGGLTALHFLLLFPFTAACAYCGYLREERGLE